MELLEEKKVEEEKCSGLLEEMERFKEKDT